MGDLVASIFAGVAVLLLLLWFDDIRKGGAK